MFTFKEQQRYFIPSEIYFTFFFWKMNLTYHNWIWVLNIWLMILAEIFTLKKKMLVYIHIYLYKNEEKTKVKGSKTNKLTLLLSKPKRSHMACTAFNLSFGSGILSQKQSIACLRAFILVSSLVFWKFGAILSQNLNKSLEKILKNKWYIYIIF